MDAKNLCYFLMIIAQMACLCKLGREADTCGWSRQARWIAWRVGGVILTVFLMTVFFLMNGSHNDILLEYIIILGLAAMTILLVSKLPAILDGMSDEEVGEDLNIRKEEPESNGDNFKISKSQKNE